ncbi:ribosome biogenesis GTP-binding protein YihA/YsxC [Thermodesulforhabdus norvegica]|uniref:Probable GTP-binding protein EngB n=1 Tax=Thermodesulforhabdus norvegica TaxID=39841 RepID=A0A1I4U9L1_9BACT|nr:ribosome biogenesis GTP-binding protein YihA/YsxC [Thermodesulforhabdus norvegica]SFM85541.1 GTP-binding protein [Thermodesulforhabdus norvegica]
MSEKGLKITHAEFYKSVYSLDQLPEEKLPEIAFAGRSNVGKSSLINCLVQRKKLVHTSSTPGKTRSINFYLINRSFYFVDLPGYGYAKVSKSIQARWRPLVEGYLKDRATLRAVVLIIDSRHPPTASDIQLKDWLQFHRINTIPVLTKIDKVRKSDRQRHREEASRLLGIPVDEIFLFSSTEKIGREELLKQIVSLTEHQ